MRSLRTPHAKAGRAALVELFAEGCKPDLSPTSQSKRDLNSSMCAVTEYAAESCALECKEKQESAQGKLTEKDTDGLAKLKVCFQRPNQAEVLRSKMAAFIAHLVPYGLGTQRLLQLFFKQESIIETLFLDRINRHLLFG